jgi:hypothetical protein
MEKEFIKEQIKNLKNTTIEENKLYDSQLFNEDHMYKVFAGVHDTAYNLLKALIGEDWDKVEQLEPKWEELVFSTFTSYMYDPEITLDSFLEWFDTYIIKK